MDSNVLSAGRPSTSRARRHHCPLPPQSRPRSRHTSPNGFQAPQRPQPHPPAPSGATTPTEPHDLRGRPAASAHPSSPHPRPRPRRRVRRCPRGARWLVPPPILSADEARRTEAPRPAAARRNLVPRRPAPALPSSATAIGRPAVLARAARGGGPSRFPFPPLTAGSEATSPRPSAQTFPRRRRSSQGRLAILVGNRGGPPSRSLPPLDPSSAATVRPGTRACRADSVRGGDALRAAPLMRQRRGGPTLPLPLTPPPPPPRRAARTSRRRRPSRPARRDGDVHATSGRGPGTSANRAAPGLRDAADECPLYGLVRHGPEGMAKRASWRRTRRTTRRWDLHEQASARNDEVGEP